MSRPAKAKPRAKTTDPGSVTVEASPDLTFEVTPGRFGTHVLLKETRSGQCSIQQSMIFASESSFMDWHEHEHRRHNFPCAYARLRTHVLSLLSGRGRA